MSCSIWFESFNQSIPGWRQERGWRQEHDRARDRHHGELLDAVHRPPCQQGPPVATSFQLLIPYNISSSVVKISSLYCCIDRSMDGLIATRGGCIMVPFGFVLSSTDIGSWPSSQSDLFHCRCRYRRMS